MLNSIVILYEGETPSDAVIENIHDIVRPLTSGSYSPVFIRVHDAESISKMCAQQSMNTESEGEKVLMNEISAAYTVVKKAITLHTKKKEYSSMTDCILGISHALLTWGGDELEALKRAITLIHRKDPYSKHTPLRKAVDAIYTSCYVSWNL